MQMQVFKSLRELLLSIEMAASSSKIEIRRYKLLTLVNINL